MDLSAHRVLLKDGNLVVELEGRLRRSGRPLRLRLALGFTELFGPVAPRHSGLLRRALVAFLSGYSYMYFDRELIKEVGKGPCAGVIRGWGRRR